MSQKRADCQPSALLMLSSEEMSCTLLGGLNDSNIPSLLALPQELPNTSTDSASQLFLAEDGDVDNFLGQTTPTPGPHQTLPHQKTSVTTISSFISNPFSNPLSGSSHASPLNNINQANSSTISQPPTNNLITAPPPQSRGDEAGNPYQYRMVGKYQHVPPPSYYQPPPQQVPLGPPPAPSPILHNPQTTQGPPPQVPNPYSSRPPGYGQYPLAGPPPNSSHHPGFTPPVGGFYKPIESHWFYAEEVDGKTVWMPFSRADSAKLEGAFVDEEKIIRPVPVEAGRYDVDIPKRLKKSVYWKEEEEEEGKGEAPTRVRRCSWFYRPEGDANFVPYDEKFAAGLEESYRHAIQTSDFHKRLAFPSGETIIIHGPNSIVHYPPSSQPDAWGNAMGDLRPLVVRRGVAEFENIPRDENDKVDHLVLVVMGFNHEAKKVVHSVDKFRRISEQMQAGHFSRPRAEGRAGRVEFLPVVWSDRRLLQDIAGVDKMIKTLTLASIGKLRRFTNETLTELMFYSSPSHAQTSAALLTQALNSTYETFKSRHEEFVGGISIVGHGVGSVIVYDILANQGEGLLDPKDAKQPSCPEQPIMELSNQIQPGLKRSLNDSSSSLASLAESDRMTLGVHSTLSEVLEKLGLKDYEEKFKSEQIDVASLVLLEDSDAKEMGLPLGPRKKLRDFIKKTQVQNAPGPDASKGHQTSPKPPVQQFVQQQQPVEQNIESSNDGMQSAAGCSRTTFTFQVKSSEEKNGRGGVDVLVRSYSPLKFKPENFFALGSPVAMVLALRGSDLLGEEFCLPTCSGYFNIFHPSDPLAYRMEPLVLPSVPHKAVLVPHHKGRKRLHLELKENLARIGSDIKQRIVESFRSTWRTINNFASVYRGGRPSLPEPKVDEDEVDREVSGVLAEMQREADDAGSVVASSVADDSDFPVGSLNQGRRIDFVLQEKPLEIFNDYIFALASSSCYWQSEDTALMMLKEIYLAMGIMAQKPGTSGYPQPGLPLGPPPKSGFVQSSAITREQGPTMRASPYAPYSSSSPAQPPPYQQPYWSTPGSESYQVGPPPQSQQMGSYPTSRIGPPPTTNPIGPPLSNPLGSHPVNPIGPPPTNPVRHPPTNPIGPPPTNPVRPPPTNPIGPPPPSSQMFHPTAGQSTPQSHPMHAPSQPYQFGGFQHRPSTAPPPPMYYENRHQVSSGPPPMAPGRPLGPPPRIDFVKLN